MKLYKQFFLFGMAFFLSFTLKASTFPNTDSTKYNMPMVGQKSLLIGINPVISFVGNLFNGQTYNNLNLNAGTLVFRKYIGSHESKRIRLRYKLSSMGKSIEMEDVFPYILNNGTEVTHDYDIIAAFGKEKRKQYKKFSLYYGWEWVVGFEHYSSRNNFTYELNDEIVSPYSTYYFNRTVVQRNENNAIFGINGLVGVDFHFSTIFYVNFEFSIPLICSVGLKYFPINENVAVDRDQMKIVEVLRDETQKPNLTWSINSNNDQYLQFRAGAVF